jgi:hypothetical protein
LTSTGPAQQVGTGDFSRCDGTGKSVNDPAFEIEYTPDGVDTGLCAGVAVPDSDRAPAATADLDGAARRACSPSRR